MELFTDLLTEREKEVLQLACKGKQVLQIADELGVSENYIHQIKRDYKNKLGAETNEQAAVMALNVGIIE